MSDKSNDPLAMWQKMIGEMGKGFGSFANRAMALPESDQVGGAKADPQKNLGDLMEKYLVSMNLPSRAQMVSMDERLQWIEGQLNEIRALLQVQKEGGSGAAPRAQRARRAPPSGEQS